MLRKSFLPALLVISFFTFGLGSTLADEVTFEGSTIGAFSSGTPPGLTYTAGTFYKTTEGGVAALGGLPGNSLGSFELIADGAVYDGKQFTLSVTFTLPAGITGGGSQSFTATLIGSAVTNSGVTTIGFDSVMHTFTFNNGTQSGSFTFYVSDVSVSAGHTAELTGYITASVPEPSAVLLLGMGLIGVAIIARRVY